MSNDKKVTVFDLPTRLFHWLFALLFLGAYLIVEVFDEESTLFSLHMIAGLVIAFMLVLRIVWGFIGTTYARFSSFALRPTNFFGYMKDAIVAKTKRYLGHNPASSYAAIIMFVSAAGLAVTGVMMTSGAETELYEEIHKLLADLLLITAAVHVGGIIFHHLRHNDSLWSSMMDGKKKSLPDQSGIKSSKQFAGIVFLILTLSWTGYLYSTYDSASKTLNIFGQEMVIGEEEHEDHEYEEDEYNIQLDEE